MGWTGEAIVCGAGIGGLAAALALARGGAQVRVYERAGSLGEVGAGVQIGPNAVRALGYLGIDAQTLCPWRPAAASIRDGRTGRARLRVPLGETAASRWGAPYLTVHRADLHAALSAAAAAAGAEVTLGASAERYREGDLVLTGGGAVTAELIVGSDGARSVVARDLGAPPPRFTGTAAWRALIPAASLPEGFLGDALPNETVSWTGRGRHLVTYAVRGGALVNLVAVIEHMGWTEESWTTAGDPAAMRTAFSGWYPPLDELLARVEETYLWGLFDRQPLARWTDGRAVVLGDAAHPMLPFLAQGASMALEDAVVLARAIAAYGVPRGLSAFEAVRRPRTARLQRQSAENRTLFHGGGLGPAKLRAASLMPAAALARLDRIYATDVTTAPI